MSTQDPLIQVGTNSGNQTITTGSNSSNTSLTAITPESLQSQTALSIPTFQPIAPPAVPNVADQILQQSQVQDTPTQQLGQNLSQTIYDLLPNLKGESAALTQAQQDAGVNQGKKELQDINSQILAKQAEVNQDDVTLASQINDVQKVPGQLTPIVEGKQRQLQMDASIVRALKVAEIGVLNARALAKQGDIQLAMDTAQKAVDAKYAPYKEAISIYQQQLQAIQPLLTKDDKKQADAQQLKINLALQQIQDQKDTEKQINSVMVQAAQAGADPNTLALIQKATSVPQAISLAGNALGAEFKHKLEEDAFNNRIQQAQLAISQQNANTASGNLALEKLKFQQSLQTTGTILDGSIQTTVSGKQYVDSSQYKGKEYDAARAAAAQAHIPFVNKDSAEALSEVDQARLNQKTINDYVHQFLPQDAQGRLTVGPENKISKFLQTNDKIAAFSAFRTAAINTLRATAGSKGLRINQAEIQAAIDNDIPKITDTIGVADQKFKNITSLLNNVESSIVTSDRSQLIPTNGTQLQDPHTGEIKTFSNLSPSQLTNAQNQGFKIIK